MRCCTLYSRKDGLHGINALMVISECDIRRNKEAWGETPEKDQGAISQNTSEMLRGSTNSWLGRHHGDGLAHFTSTRQIWPLQTMSQQQAVGREGFYHPLLTGGLFHYSFSGVPV